MSRLQIGMLVWLFGFIVYMCITRGDKMKKILISIGYGILGFILSFSIWHLYEDHVIFHQIVTFLTKPQPSPSPK